MIIAVCHRKGGTGKTTVATSVACELSRLGNKVLLVDSDPQGTASDWREFASDEGNVPTVVGMATETLHRPGQVNSLAENYDHTVIDCPPALGPITRSALMVADVALIPTRPNAADLWALQDTLDLLQDARAFKPELQARIVVSQKPVSSRGGDLGANELKKLGAEADAPILKTMLHMRVAYSNAMLAGSYAGAEEAQGKAAREIKALVKELLKIGG